MAMSMLTLKKHHNVSDPVNTLGIDSVLCFIHDQRTFEGMRRLTVEQEVVQAAACTTLKTDGSITWYARTDSGK